LADKDKGNVIKCLIRRGGAQFGTHVLSALATILLGSIQLFSLYSFVTRSFVLQHGSPKSLAYLKTKYG
jgi:hypothetical protein